MAAWPEQRLPLSWLAKQGGDSAISLAALCESCEASEALALERNDGLAEVFPREEIGECFADMIYPLQSILGRLYRAVT